MMGNSTTIDKAISNFAPVGLEELNTRAAMLTRVDNKYIVQHEDLLGMLSTMTEDFEVLEIEDLRAFRYSTRYFDDEVLSAYYQHHQGKRKGFKVRIRRYEDAEISFVELKVKGKRGGTVKKRLPYPFSKSDHLDDTAIGFVKHEYREHYDQDFTFDVRTSLDIEYNRITLVSKTDGERLTIDTGLTFRNNDKSVCLGDSVYIVETKSMYGRGVADTLFRNQHIYPIKRCSKYCVGVAALARVSRCNHFLPAMRKLGIAPDLDLRAA